MRTCLLSLIGLTAAVNDAGKSCERRGTGVLEKRGTQYCTPKALGGRICSKMLFTLGNVLYGGNPCSLAANLGEEGGKTVTPANTQTETERTLNLDTVKSVPQEYQLE